MLGLATLNQWRRRFNPRPKKTRHEFALPRCRNRPKHMISLEREMTKRQEGRQAGRGMEGAQEHATTLVFEQLWEIWR
jgi:hypothetical protein